MKPTTTYTASKWHMHPSKIPRKGKSYNVTIQGDVAHSQARGKSCSLLAFCRAPVLGPWKAKTMPYAITILAIRRHRLLTCDI